jgi:hypothetical protein
VAHMLLLKACNTTRADIGGQDGTAYGRRRTPTQTLMARGRMADEGAVVGECGWGNLEDRVVGAVALLVPL